MKTALKKYSGAIKIALFLSFAALFLFPLISSAEVNLVGPEDVIEPQIPVTEVGDIYTILEDALGFISYIFWIAAIGFIFYAAYIYLVAGGDAEKVKKASQQLWWAVVAIAVALMATVIPFIVQSILNQDYVSF